MSRRPLPLPRILRVVTARQLGYVTVRQCRELGTDYRARKRRFDSGSWSQAAPGVIDTEPDVLREIAEKQRRQVEVALLAAGDGAVAVGLAALLLHGCWGLPTAWRARAVRDTRRRGRGGAQNHVFTTVTAGGRRASDVRSAILQVLPEVDRLHLVAILDWALHEGHIESVDALARLGSGRRWIRKLRGWGPLADGRAESILETWARLQCIDEGVPPTTLQLPIRDADGSVRARGDLAWRLPNGRWLVVEIDGAYEHDKPTTIRRDRHRQNWVVAGGVVTVLRYDASDLRAGVLAGEVRRFRAQLAAA